MVPYHTDSEDGQQILALAHGGVHLLSGQAGLKARMRRLTFTLEDNSDTLLTGPVVDQAALHGVLKKVRDVGIPLLSVVRVKPDQAEASVINETHH